MIAIDAEHFRGRVFQDSLTEATAIYWERRAAAFEWAAPRPGDFTGQATDPELRERVRSCRAVAQACRRHAGLLREGQPVSSEVWAVLSEVA